MSAETEMVLVPIPMDLAPVDGTMVRLLVKWTAGADVWAPLTDELQSWTIGFNGFENTEENVWQYVGWSWSQDCFHDCRTDQGWPQAIGWLPISAPEIARPAAPAEEGEPVAYRTGINGVTLRHHVEDWSEPRRSEGLASPPLYASPDPAVARLTAERDEARAQLASNVQTMAKAHDVISRQKAALAAKDAEIARAVEDERDRLFMQYMEGGASPYDPMLRWFRERDAREPVIRATLRSQAIPAEGETQP